MNSAPFFVVGSGRSGSTLLRAILASHSRLCIPPETWYLLPLLKRLRTDRPLSSAEVDSAARIMINHYRWPDMGLDERAFRQQLAELKSPYLSDVIEVVYRNHLERDNKLRWGDKTPGYIAVIPQLANMFPDSKFIHLFRDGRDVTKSFQAQRWYGPWLHDNAYEWNEAMDYNLRWSSSPLATRILQLRYEDLVLDTEKKVRDVCGFLGERFEPPMLSWQSTIDRVVLAREAHIHEKLNQRPNPADVNRWKREMTRREIFVCEAFMRKHLERSGYERKYESALWEPIFALTRWYCYVVLSIISFNVRVFRFLRNWCLRQPKHDRRSGARG